MDHKRPKRIKRRITCELVIDGKRQSGIMLDVSATGMFVQTAVNAAVNQEVEVHLAATRTTPALTVRGRVARGRRVPPQLLASAGGGLGLRIINPPPGFAQLIAGDDEAATPEPSSPAKAQAPKSEKRAVPQRRFQVRLQAVGSTRSRLVTVQCPDSKTAGVQACQVVGRGWEVVDVTEQP